MKRKIIASLLVFFTIIIGYALLYNFMRTQSHQKTELILIQWDKVDVLLTEPKLDALLTQHREWIKNRLEKGEPYTWENFVLPINEQEDELHQLWFPVAHLSALLKPKESLREKSEVAYANCEKKITEYTLELAQNKAMYDAYATVGKTKLLPEQTQAIKNILRGYTLSGIFLSEPKKRELTNGTIEQNELSKKFEENVTYSANLGTKQITDENILIGLPDTVKNVAKDLAQKNKKPGYLLTLGDDTVGTVLLFAKNRKLREEMYLAVFTEASKNGPGGEKYDNTPIIERLLELRYHEAKLLGFNNYAELALQTRMATNTKEVTDFLNDLKVRSQSFAKKQFQELTAFAQEKDGLSKIEPWDVSYYLQMMKKEKFSFSEEDTRPYFPLSKVVDGLSQVANKLYGITLKERHGVSVWHTDVKFYEAYGKDGGLLGALYMDLFQREGKSSGGWANSVIDRYQKIDGTIQLPIGLIVMNFRPPKDGDDALLTLQDVTELFHEFGHNTQKLLTRVNARDVSGSHGVPWDGIELPSQFMENFVWQPEVIDMISGHYKTGEKLPPAFLEKALEMRKFGKGMRMTGGLVLEIFDFRLHMEYKPNEKGMAERIYAETYKNTAMTTMQPWMSTYPNSFLHIFAGGYAAGYYSYPWAEVLSADDFTPFIKNGKIDWSVGKKFEDEILSRGGSRLFMESNEAFLGRKPTVDALIKQYGFN